MPKPKRDPHPLLAQEGFGMDRQGSHLTGPQTHRATGNGLGQTLLHPGVTQPVGFQGALSGLGGVGAESLLALGRLMATSVLLGLGEYVKRGLPIRIKQSYITFSGSQEVSTMLISSMQQIAKWGKVTKDLISALLKR